MFKEMPKESIYEFARQMVPCVGFNTRRASRLITQYYDQALAPAGLRSTQYSLLTALTLLDEAYMQDLAFVLAMDRTTLTRNLKPLLNKNLIEVSTGKDRRAHPIKMTPMGKSVLELATPYWEKAQGQIVNSLGAANWNQIMRGLHQISMIVEENSI